MFDKNDLGISKILSTHPLGRTYIVQTLSTPKKYTFELRSMYKNKILEQNEKTLIFYEKKFRLKMRHPFLANTICTFQDCENLYILSEMPRGKYLFSLLNHLCKMNPNDVKFYISELLLVINYIHKKGRCYYHLIPTNIMLDEKGHIKLRYDYMNLNGLDDDVYNNNVEYLGFEYFMGYNVTYRSDYWAVGAIMYELLFGYSPFRGCTVEETIENVKYGKFDMPPGADPFACDLIRILLSKHSFVKMNHMNAFMYIKKHKFFKDIDWGAVESKNIKSPHEHLIKPLELARVVPMNTFSGTSSKKRDHDGYSRIFYEYSVIEEYDCKYEMDLN